jgi:hypothetical protein
MKVLFLHGWQSVPGGVKPTYLARHGHEVINPKLPDDDFAEAVRIAQVEVDKHQPDVVVGSSRGGAVAMNIISGGARLVLLCPALKKWGTVQTVKPGTVILHSRADDVIPFADSEELVRNSGPPASALIEAGNDHRLADPEPLAAMLGACERCLPDEQRHLPCCGATPVRRLKEPPHAYGFDFDLFRCGRCNEPWVGYWLKAAEGGGWKPGAGGRCGTDDAPCQARIACFHAGMGQGL